MAEWKGKEAKCEPEGKAGGHMSSAMRQQGARAGCGRSQRAAGEAAHSRKPGIARFAVGEPSCWTVKVWKQNLFSDNSKTTSDTIERRNHGRHDGE